MKILNDLQRAAYDLLAAFFDAISTEDAAKLETLFSISPAVYSEIRTSLAEYLVETEAISLPSIAFAFKKTGRNRPTIDMFQMNDECSWGIECVIWCDGRPQEPILHAEMIQYGTGYALKFRYIGS